MVRRTRSPAQVGHRSAPHPPAGPFRSPRSNRVPTPVECRPMDRRVRRRKFGIASLLTVVSVAAAALFGPTLTPSAPAEVTASWPQFHGQPDHLGYNPLESVLETQSVTGLGIAWTAQTGGAITSSPTVANGMVYLSSYD